MHTFMQEAHKAPGTMRDASFSSGTEPEAESLSVRRELAALQNRYRELGLEVSRLAHERDAALAAREKTEAYIDSIRAGARIEGDASVFAPRAVDRQSYRRRHTSDRGQKRDGPSASRLSQADLSPVRRELAALERDYLHLAERADTIAYARDEALRELEQAQLFAETLNRLSDSDKDNATALRKIQELTDALEKSRDEHARVSSANQEQIRALHQRLAGLEAELAAARRQVLTQQGALAQAEGLHQGALERQQQLQNTLQEERDALARRDRQIRGSEARAAELQSENESIGKRLADSERELAAAHEANETLSIRLQKTLHEHQRSQAMEQAEIAALQQRIGEIQSELDSARAELKDSDALRVALASQKTAAEEQLQLLMQAQETRNAGREQQLVELRDAEQRLEAEINETNRRLADAEQARTIAVGMNHSLTGELDSLREEYAETRHRDQDHIEILQRRFADLQPELEAAKCKIEKLELALAEASDHPGNAASQNAAAQETEPVVRSKGNTQSDKPDHRKAKAAFAGTPLAGRRENARNWLRVAAGFVVLLGVLSSLAKFRGIDYGVARHAAVSEKVAVIGTPSGNAERDAVAPATPEYASLESAESYGADDATEEDEEDEASDEELLEEDLLTDEDRADMIMGRAWVESGGPPPLVRGYLMEPGDAADIWYDKCVKGGGVAKECAFLEKNLFKEGVVRLPSGAQYSVIRNGSGASPGPHDKVLVNFRGMLLDGTEFDSSRRRGGADSFRVDEAIPGLQDVLPYMEEGARWEVYIPSELAFPKPAPFGGQTVVFDIELVAIDEAR